MTSIRQRTSGLVAISIAALLALGGVALFLVVRAALTGQFDDGLSTRAAALQSLTRFDGTKVEMDVAGEILPRYKPGAEAEYFVAWVSGPGGWKELGRSESLRGDVMHEWTQIARYPTPINCKLPDGRAGRLTSIEFVPSYERDEEHPNAVVGAAPDVRLIVAQSRAGLDRVLWTIGVSIGTVGIVLVVISILTTRWAVARGTRPLESLSARVATIGPETLERRLTKDDLPSELMPVVDRVNELVARLEQAFVREKRFTSAASHELRTPIAELKMLLEVGLSRARTSGQWEQTAIDGLAVLTRAQSLTESLLRLARAGSVLGAQRAEATADVAAILRQQVAIVTRFRGRDPACVRIRAPEPLLAHIDGAIAASIIGNLIDNACLHGSVDAENEILCVGTHDSGAVSVVIANHAPSLEEQDVGRMFEPFWRKDDSRSGSGTGGAGLGLAVARSLAVSEGATLTAALDKNRRLCVTLRVSDAISPDTRL